MSFHCLKTLQAELRPIYLTDIIDSSDLLNTTSLIVSNKNLSVLNNLPFSCSSIKTLDLSHNKLKTLSGLCQFQNLTSINLSYNQIISLSELNYIQNKSNTLNLFLKGNPCTRHPNALPQILAIFPRLRKFDGVEISDNLKQDLSDGYKLERKILKFFIETIKIIRKLELGVKGLKIEYELLQACKGNISAESGPYWEDINARHLRELNKMVKIPKISDFWIGCEIKPCNIIDLTNFVGKALNFKETEESDEKEVFEWVYKEVMVRLHKWGLHSLQLYLQENIPGLGENEDILYFKDLKMQPFRISESEKPKKKLNPVMCEGKNLRFVREWEVFPVFPSDKGYLKAIFELVQEQVRKIVDLQREKLELLSFDSSSIGIPSFSDKFYESTNKSKFWNRVLGEVNEENRIKKVENGGVQDFNQKKMKIFSEVGKNNENYFGTIELKLENSEKKSEDLQNNPFSCKHTKNQILVYWKKALKILTTPLNRHNLHILHKILNISSLKKSINHYNTTLLKKYLSPIRYLYILHKAKTLKSRHYYNSRLILDSFYSIRNSALQNKHLKKRKKEKEALKALKNQESQKLVQQKYENLISRLTENKQNIQKIWKILKENPKIPQEKCSCGGFKCPDCISTKLAYIKKELQFLKQKLPKQPK